MDRARYICDYLIGCIYRRAEQIYLIYTISVGLNQKCIYAAFAVPIAIFDEIPGASKQKLNSSLPFMRFWKILSGIIGLCLFRADLQFCSEQNARMLAWKTRTVMPGDAGSIASSISSCAVSHYAEITEITSGAKALYKSKQR